MAITDNLIAYWDLSEASGTRADSSGAGETLTDNNTVTGTTGPGSHNASLMTVANSEWLSHVDDANLSMADIDMTAVIWIKLTSLIASATFLGQWKTTTSDRSWIVNIDSATPFPIAARASGTGGSGPTFLTPASGAAPTGTWLFVVFWHDSVANTINLQTNNGTVYSGAHTVGLFNSAADFAIGSSDGGFYQDGAVAMCGIWKRVLTSTELTTLYNSGNGLAYSELAPAVVVEPTVIYQQAVQRGAFF